MVTKEECDCINSSLNVIIRSIKLERDAIHISKYNGKEKEALILSMKITANDLSRNIDELENNCPVTNLARDQFNFFRYKDGKNLLGKFLNNPTDEKSAKDAGSQIANSVDIGIRNYLIRCPSSEKIPK